MEELTNLTRSGAKLEVRQKQLASLFNNHYDAPKIAFIVQFLCGVKGNSLSKADAIKVLVEQNAPFIPFDIFNEHLARSLTEFRGKRSFPSVNWLGCYERFCSEVPFPDVDLEGERKSAKLALGVSYWQNCLVTHNAAVPEKKQLTLSDKEFNMLTGSQFSVTAGGTPNLHADALAGEDVLRQKLLTVHESAIAKRKELLREADEFERKALDIRGALSVSSSGSFASKRKTPSSSSTGNAEPTQGIHALDNFMLAIRRKIDDADYIDFAAMSTDRLRGIKMLNAASSKSTRLSVDIVVRHSVSEADVAILTDDLLQIYDGFFFHYLRLVSESRLPDPMATIMDRISWWQWMATNFMLHPAAQVKFIKSFLVDHHKAPFWTPLVKSETTLMLLCKQECAISTSGRPAKVVVKQSAGPQRSSGHTITTKPSARKQRTPAQQAKFEAWMARFPNFCHSRIFRGMKCHMESRNLSCRFTHTCAWCGAASCKATCGQAETF
jgi:hypothetical protein